MNHMKHIVPVTLAALLVFSAGAACKKKPNLKKFAEVCAKLERCDPDSKKASALAQGKGLKKMCQTMLVRMEMKKQTSGVSVSVAKCLKDTPCEEVSFAKCFSEVRTKLQANPFLGK